MKIGRVLITFAGLAVIMGGLYACVGPPSDLRDDHGIWDVTRLSVDAPIGADESTQIAAYTQGPSNARTVILVHGTPGSAEGWRDFMTMAGDSFHFIAIDRPGFGESGPEGAVTSLAQQAAALRPFLKPENGLKPILMGHSLGGPVVVRAAMDYPDLVGGLILAAGAFDPDLEKVYAIQHLGDSFLLSWALPRAMRNANRELIALEDELVQLSKGIAQMRLPIIMVHGTEDDLVPYANVDYMRKTLPEDAPFTLARLDGQNHFLPWNSKEILLDAIQELDRHLIDNAQARSNIRNE
ncbi:hypothetical protein GCM10007972_11770 [Iodidimonas muriae]|uniref:AB hydrolase-1 domain-containing protein n=1 Tax=Iodidimonas muriae TaxID=261467 RepID=A0ABQ2LC11_9PROT|nr:alpha/beta hydrolase [Iodidimonas muriae]GER06834.1 hypothetical protein JCM17843_11440 [Kordiimonadales bacterium JCM 17843]GGO09827.1 hypothetical protein GCM10007972_11770 [Iodidimonas muriae]